MDVMPMSKGNLDPAGLPDDDEALLEEEEFGFEETENADPGSPGGLYEHFAVIADPGQRPLRVDKFLTDRMIRTSRNRIRVAADAGKIFVNGLPVKSNYKVKPLDRITLELSRPKHVFEIIPEDIPLEVVYEDPDLLVVNKSAGMVVHPGNGNFDGTLINALAYHLRETKTYDPGDPRLGLVHRIDKDTSGLLVVAKNAEAKTFLARQFFQKTTKRTYEAVVWGRFEEPAGTVRSNIARNPNNRIEMRSFPYGGEIGKTAVTHYRVLETLAYVSRVACTLETGRTHQIRVHMRQLGHPLFADERYGGDKILRGNNSPRYRRFAADCMAVCPRQALHAGTLGFVHPRSGEEMLFTAELPADINELIEHWRAYTQTLTEI